MKLGILLLQNGVWDERRILPEAWIAEAVRPQIAIPGSCVRPWCSGYGYQFWTAPGGAFRAHGTFCQDSFMFPEKKLALSIQCREGTEEEGLLRRLHREVLQPLELS